MARLIDADALRDDTYIFDAWDAKIVRAWLDDQPTVDAVEVVRCKDCKYWSGYGGRCKHWGSPLAGTVHYTNAGDFCSYGERKDNDT